MSVSGDSDDEDLSLESLTQHLSRHTEQRPLSTNSMGGAVCCCGSDQCESLRKNQNIVQELESQMKIAGSLGQVSARRLPRFCVSFSHGVCVGCFSGELVLLASVMSGFFPCFFFAPVLGCCICYAASCTSSSYAYTHTPLDIWLLTPHPGICRHCSNDMKARWQKQRPDRHRRRSPSRSWK
jgi:hypothetical protein